VTDVYMQGSDICTFVLFTSYFPIPRIIRNPTNLDVE
jgi:hypothetical protein